MWARIASTTSYPINITPYFTSYQDFYIVSPLSTLRYRTALSTLRYISRSPIITFNLKAEARPFLVILSFLVLAKALPNNQLLSSLSLLLRYISIYV